MNETSITKQPFSFSGNLWYYGPAKGEAVSTPAQEWGAEKMPITITLHIFGCTITISVKKQNRHPAR